MARGVRVGGPFAIHTKLGVGAVIVLEAVCGLEAQLSLKTGGPYQSFILKAVTCLRIGDAIGCTVA